MKKVRSECAKEVKSQLTQAAFNHFKHHFPNRGWKQKISLANIDMVLAEVHSQITSLQSLKSQYENLLDDATQDDKEGFWHEYSLGKFAALFLNIGESSDTDDEEESITEDQYIDICDQLNRLQVAQGVIERRLKKMNAQVDQKMTLDFLLKRFTAHKNPKFNTSLPEGNARVRALLKDIYCIE